MFKFNLVGFDFRVFDPKSSFTSFILSVDLTLVVIWGFDCMSYKLHFDILIFEFHVEIK